MAWSRVAVFSMRTRVLPGKAPEATPLMDSVPVPMELTLMASAASPWYTAEGRSQSQEPLELLKSVALLTLTLESWANVTEAPLWGRVKSTLPVVGS